MYMPVYMKRIVMSLKIQCLNNDKTYLGYMNSNSLHSVPRNSAILHLLFSVLQPSHLGKVYLPGQVSGLAFLSHLLQHLHCMRLFI